MHAAYADIRQRIADPPRHAEASGELGGCVGDTMNAIPSRVLETWHQDRERNRKERAAWTQAGEIGAFDYNLWYRSPELEGVYEQR